MHRRSHSEGGVAFLAKCIVLYPVRVGENDSKKAGPKAGLQGVLHHVFGQQQAKTRAPRISGNTSVYAGTRAQSLSEEV